MKENVNGHFKFREEVFIWGGSCLLDFRHLYFCTLAESDNNAMQWMQISGKATVEHAKQLSTDLAKVEDKSICLMLDTKQLKKNVYFLNFFGILCIV